MSDGWHHSAWATGDNFLEICWRCNVENFRIHCSCVPHRPANRQSTGAGSECTAVASLALWAEPRPGDRQKGASFWPLLCMGCGYWKWELIPLVDFPPLSCHQGGLSTPKVIRIHKQWMMMAVMIITRTNFLELYWTLSMNGFMQPSKQFYNTHTLSP